MLFPGATLELFRKTTLHEFKLAFARWLYAPTGQLCFAVDWHILWTRRDRTIISLLYSFPSVAAFILMTCGTKMCCEFYLSLVFPNVIICQRWVAGVRWRKENITLEPFSRYGHSQYGASLRERLTVYVDNRRTVAAINHISFLNR